MFFPSRSGGFQLKNSDVLVMGVLNVTPDSFSDGGSLYSGQRPDISKVLERVSAMLEEGAAIIDVGGESTRPGAAPVELQQEMDRVLPIIEAIANEHGCVISVDTSRPEIMREAVRLGAGLINDVRALGQPGALEATAEAEVPVCLMHMQGGPASMQDNPGYRDVVEDVICFLGENIQRAEQAGIKSENIVIDPGFGFGKTLQHNLQLLKSLDKLQILAKPLLVGLSRKSMLGTILDKPVDQRVYGGVATTVIAVQKGAQIIRTHDVMATADAIKVVAAMKNSYLQE